MIFVGVDPGDSLGLVVVDGFHRVLAYQGDWVPGMSAFSHVLDAAAPEMIAVACERFVNAPSRQRKTSQPTAQKIVGMVEFECAKRKIPLTLQMPAPAHAIAKNDFLRAIGFYTSAADVGQLDADDVNMAARHVVLLMATRHATLFSRLAAKAERP